MLSMYKQITIKTLKKQGKANQDIAAAMQCHRNTVRNILSHDHFIERQTRERLSYFSSCKNRIKELLKSDISRLRIWEILRDEQGNTKSYIALCSFIRRHFPAPVESFVVQQTNPGQEAEVDFGFLGKIKTSAGVVKKVWGFVMVLAYSRHAFYSIAFDQSSSTFISLHMAAFSSFGGVPKRIKYDNLKAAVLKNSRYELEFNRTFMEFSSHYGFVIVPCTPYQPQQKGKVESGIGYMEGNFWAGRTFTDEHDCERQLTHWMNTIANKRVHGTTKRIPAEVFSSEEKQAVLVLPQEPFIFFDSVMRLVKPNCHVNFQNNYYSVPFRHVGTSVEVRWQGNIITIYADEKQIARHVMSEKTGQYVTSESHFPQDKVFSATTYQAKHEQKMRAIGSSSHTFFLAVVKEDPKGWVKTIRGITGLAHQFGNETVEKALKRALVFNALHLGTVRGICEKHLENAPVEPFLLRSEYQESSKQEKQDSIIPLSSEKDSGSRDLSYYAPLTAMMHIDAVIQEEGGTVLA